MIILIKLLFAHFLGDFVLQSKSWIIDKEKNRIKSSKLYLHTMLHGLLVLIVLWNFHFWHIALLLMLVHGIVDIVKLYAQQETTKLVGS